MIILFLDILVPCVQCDRARQRDRSSLNTVYVDCYIPRADHPLRDVQARGSALRYISDRDCRHVTRCDVIVTWLAAARRRHVLMAQLSLTSLVNITRGAARARIFLQQLDIT